MPPKRKYSGVLQLVSNTSSHASDPCIFRLRRYCQARKVRSQSGHISGQRHVHENDPTIQSTVSICFAALRQIRSIRRSVSHPGLLSLGLPHTSLLDYSSVNLIGISRRLQDRLHSMLNAAARLVCNGRKYDHITPLLRDVHWLRNCASHNVLRSVWPFLRSAAAIARHQNTWRETCSGQLTITHVCDSDLRRVTNWSSGAPD